MAKPLLDSDESSDDEGKKSPDLKILEDALCWARLQGFGKISLYDAVARYPPLKVNLFSVASDEISEIVKRISFCFVNHLCAFAEAGHLIDPSPRSICAFFDKHIKKSNLPDIVKEHDAESGKNLCAREVFLNWAHKLLETDPDNAVLMATDVFDEFFRLQIEQLTGLPSFRNDIDELRPRTFAGNESDEEPGAWALKEPRDEKNSDAGKNRATCDDNLHEPLERIRIRFPTWHDPFNKEKSNDSVQPEPIDLIRNERICEDDKPNTTEIEITRDEHTSDAQENRSNGNAEQEKLKEEN